MKNLQVNKYSLIKVGNEDRKFEIWDFEELHCSETKLGTWKIVQSEAWAILHSLNKLVELLGL